MRRERSTSRLIEKIGVWCGKEEATGQHHLLSAEKKTSPQN